MFAFPLIWLFAGEGSCSVWQEGPRSVIIGSPRLGSGVVFGRVCSKSTVQSAASDVWEWCDIIVPVGADLFAEGLLWSCLRFLLGKYHAGYRIGLLGSSGRKVLRLCR